MKLVDFAINGEIISHERQIKERNLQTVYEYAYPRLIEQLYVHAAPSRPQDININTLANRLLKV